MPPRANGSSPLLEVLVGLVACAAAVLAALAVGRGSRERDVEDEGEDRNAESD